MSCSNQKLLSLESHFLANSIRVFQDAACSIEALLTMEDSSLSAEERMQAVEELRTMIRFETVSHEGPSNGR